MKRISAYAGIRTFCFLNKRVHVRLVGVHANKTFLFLPRFQQEVRELQSFSNLETAPWCLCCDLERNRRAVECSLDVRLAFSWYVTYQGRFFFGSGSGACGRLAKFFTESAEKFDRLDRFFSMARIDLLLMLEARPTF